MTIGFCRYCGEPTSNVHEFCSTECFDAFELDENDVLQPADFEPWNDDDRLEIDFDPYAGTYDDGQYDCYDDCPW
jgi:hypothetical protein